MVVAVGKLLCVYCRKGHVRQGRRRTDSCSDGIYRRYVIHVTSAIFTLERSIVIHKKWITCIYKCCSILSLLSFIHIQDMISKQQELSYMLIRRVVLIIIWK